jgi:hypothetical protein
MILEIYSTKKSAICYLVKQKWSQHCVLRKRNFFAENLKKYFL